MSRPVARWTMPWGLTLALLAGAVVVSMRWLPSTGEPAPGEVVESAVLIVAAAFVAMRLLQNYFWGLVTAALFIVHPLFRQWAEPMRPALWTEALELVLLAAVIAGWQLALRGAFAWRTAVLINMVVVAAILFAWPRLAGGETTGEHFRAFEREQIRQWSWPTAWAVWPLSAWGLWCTLRRGWRDYKKHRSPTSWALALYAVMSVSMPHAERSAGTVLSMASLAVLLVVFGVADFFRGLGERLILLPPES